MWEFLKEAIEFISDLAAGTMTIDDARKRATALQAKAPATFTEAGLAELDAKIAALEAVEPTDASER